MRVDRTKYTAQYENGVVRSMWVTVEIAVDSEIGDTAEGALDLSKKISDDWYKKITGVTTAPIYQDADVLPSIQQEDRRVGLFVEDINSCNDLTTLRTYKLLVRSDDKLKEAYQKKEEELMNQKQQ